MDDYRNKYCLIDDTKIMKCTGQDVNLNKIYFIGQHYNGIFTQAFWLPEERVRLLTDEELANLNLYGKINKPK